MSGDGFADVGDGMLCHEWFVSVMDKLKKMEGKVIANSIHVESYVKEAACSSKNV